MNIPGSAFKGEAPRYNPEQLPEGFAEVSLNCRFLAGGIEAWNDFLSYGEMPKAYQGEIRGLYGMDWDGSDGGPYYLHWTTGEMTYTKVDVIRGPFLGNTDDRTYYTGVGAPKVTTRELATDPPPVGQIGAYPYRWFLLGVPAPDEAPTLEVTSPEDDPTLLDLLNPGAESSTLFWTVDTGTLTSLANGAIVGFDAYEGTHFFSFGSATTAEVTQGIDSISLIPGQALTLKWVQASGANLSTSTLGLRFLDSNDDPIPDTEIFLDEQAGGVLTWGERVLNTTLPTGCETIVVVMKATKVGGGTTDAYIDDIRLTIGDATVSYDGSTLTPFTVSSNVGGSRPRRVLVNAVQGLPQPSISMQSDSSTAYFYRDFGGLNSAKIVYQENIRKHTTNWNSIVMLAGGSGAGYAVLFDTGNAKISLYQRTAWEGTTNGLFIRDLATGLSYGSTDWLTVRLEITLIDTTRASVKLFVTVYATSEILVDGETFDITISGGNFGTTSLSTTDSAVSYVDNISFTASPPSPQNPDEPISTAYVFTWVTSLGEESAPSPPSETILSSDGATVLVTTPIDPPDDRDVVFKRIYRLAGDPADFYLVEEIPYDQAEYSDTKSDSELGEVLETTEDWIPPAEDAHSITAAANGITAVLIDNQFCPSPVGRPHAYPTKWRLPMDSDGVAMGTYDTDFIVATKAHPYIFTGSDPSAMSGLRLEEPYGCVSARSFVIMKDFGAVYASREGLVSITRGSVALASFGLITEKEWATFNPTTILGCTYASQYFGFYDTGVEDPELPGETIKGGFIFDPRPNGNGWTRLDFHATAAWLNPQTGELNLVIDGERCVWNAALTKRPYRNRSRLYLVDKPTSLAAYRLRVTEGSATLRQFMDGAEVFEEVVTAADEAVLPDDVARYSIQWEIEGTGTVAIGPSMAENMDALRLLP